MKDLKIIFLSVILAFSMIFTTSAKAENSTKSSTENQDAFDIYLSDINELGSLTSGNKKVFKNAEPNGTQISLLDNDLEVTYEYGLVTPTRGVVTYSDLRKYGYESFQAYIGIALSGRSNTSSTVKFQVYGDDKLLYESDEISGNSNQQFINIDIKNIDVLKLVATTSKGSNGIAATWADAKLYKDAATPSLEVSDLEFSSPKQVTNDNILEYAKAFSADGTRDLTANITYTTNYVEGTAGEYEVTYSVTDPQNNETTIRTVDMKIRSTEDYKVNMTMAEMTTPFATYLYHGRNSSSYQAQRAWDVAVKTVLSYDNSDNQWQTISRWGETVVPVTFHFQDMGIYISDEDVSYFTSHLMDDEPRTFNMKDWGATSTKKDGVIDTVTIYIGNGMIEGSKYRDTLQTIENNVAMLYEAVQSDMSEVQMLKAVASKYSNWLKYGNGGQLLSDALANGIAVCGGNARGYIYLAERMGVKSYWVRTGSHAWAHSRVEGKWYRTDLLAGMYLCAEDGGKPYHNEARLYRHRNWVPLSTESYPQKWMNYPTLILDVKEEHLIVPGDKFDVTSLVNSVESIYDNDIVNKVQLETNIGNRPGIYNAVISVVDSRGNKVSKTCKITVVDGEGIFIPTSEAIKNTGFVDNQSISLFKAGVEVPYDFGYRSNESKEITFDISGKGYKYFETYVGIEKHVRDNTSYGHYGKVQFEVYVDDKLAYQSKVIGWKDNQEHILIPINEDTKTVRLVSIPKGGGNNHGAFGEPRFITNHYVEDAREVVKALIDVERYMTEINDTKYVLSTRVNGPENALLNIEFYRSYLTDILDHSLEYSDLQLKNTYILCVGVIEDLTGQIYEVGKSPIASGIEDTKNQM